MVVENGHALLPFALVAGGVVSIFSPGLVSWRCSCLFQPGHCRTARCQNVKGSDEGLRANALWRGQRWLRQSGLQVEKQALAGQAAAVARKCAGRSDDSMARHDHRDGVAPIG